eukprot:jgi/Mesvir1/18821/Mv06929-RA.1
MAALSRSTVNMDLKIPQQNEEEPPPAPEPPKSENGIQARTRSEMEFREITTKAATLTRVEGHLNIWEIDPEELNLAIGTRISKGAFGEIWLVNWRGTEVAVKKMLTGLEKDPHALEDFRHEIDVVMHLQHPHIVQFLGACTHQRPLMLVTEYMPRGNLHELLKTTGRLKPIQAIEFAMDIARGMNFLHMRRPHAIIHRDLKPRNIMLSDSGRLKVADFGLSKLIKPNPQRCNEKYLMTGETGSYRYMAPEVFLHRPYTKSVDVYSFAVILWELFEGHMVFSQWSPHVAASEMAYDNVRPAFTKRLYPPGAMELISECWHEDPDQRPSFNVILKRLEEIRGPTPPCVSPFLMSREGPFQLPETRSLSHNREPEKDKDEKHLTRKTSCTVQ